MARFCCRGGLEEGGSGLDSDPAAMGIGLGPHKAPEITVQQLKSKVHLLLYERYGLYKNTHHINMLIPTNFQ